MTVVALLFLSLLTTFSRVTVARADGVNNLLAEASVSANDVSHVERIVDGLVGADGDPWDGDAGARFGGTDSSVTWDLGRGRRIKCVFLQADNNDTYELAGSLDGKAFHAIWTAPPSEAPGLRVRRAEVGEQARYLRITARGGDGLFSVSELAVSGDCHAGWPNAAIARAPSQARGEAESRWGITTALLTGLMVTVLFLAWRPSRRRRPAP